MSVHKASMTAEVDLQTIYGIGSFIASQVPNLDCEGEGEPQALHRRCFNKGPVPHSTQIGQGILVKVMKCNQMPESLYSQYGEWEVLSGGPGSFEEVFDIVKQTLHLEQIVNPLLLKELQSRDYTLWAVRLWEGEEIDEVKPVKEEDYFSQDVINAEWEAFQARLRPAAYN
ncbi:MAG: hypothetical protein KGZ39_03365 [Simkania sp.]|nr:hypothetical protein [Simkania sp.]